MATLTQEERAKVRTFLGYPGLETRLTLDAGIPAANETGLVLERNMRHVLDDETLTLIRSIICRIEAIRERIDSSIKFYRVSEVTGSVKLNAMEERRLWEEDYRQCQHLASTLGTQIYLHPYKVQSSSYPLGGGGGMGSIRLFE